MVYYFLFITSKNIVVFFFTLKVLTGYDRDIPAFIPEKYFLMVNFDAL